MSFDLSSEWVDHLLLFVHTLEVGLLHLLHGLGLIGEIYDQPAWPWSRRIAVDVIAIDRGHARAVAWCVLALVTALVLLLLGLFWRRARWPSWGASVLLLVAAPWPATTLLLTSAYPSSFHESPTGYTADSIARGRQLYAQHCVACHGVDARGEGPLAAELPRWPPTLNGLLLWRRTDGDLLWHVLKGMHDHGGQPTKPGLESVLSHDEVWSVLDYLKANAAGQSLKQSGEWAQPVAVPDAPVHCDDGRSVPLSRWYGQRLRIVADNGEAVPEDPRFVTVVLSGAGRARAECQAPGEAVWNAFADIAGVDPQALAGTQFLSDRRGWLRARAVAGQAEWSPDDLLCRSGNARDTPAKAASGLDALLQRMEAEPVRLVKGGIPHG